MDKLNENQLKSFEELKIKTKDYPSIYQNDDILLQWFTARRFHVDRTIQMIENNIKWRKENNVNKIFEWDAPEVLKKYYPVSLIGHDKKGRPIWIIIQAGEDIRGILHSVSKHDYVKYTILILEKMRTELLKQSVKYSYPITQQIVIMDLEGFSLSDFIWKPCFEVQSECTKMFEDHYPEILKNAFCINAPAVFTIAYTMLRPFLDEATQNKIQIFGKQGWKETILSQLPAEVIPKYWGGTKVDADGNPKCPSIVCLGGKVPEFYYTQNKFSNSKNKSSMHTLNIGKGSCEKLEYKITIPNSKIKWEFLTDDYDIEFGLDYKGDSELEILFQHERVNSHMNVEEGEMLCRNTGTYILSFDNTYSYLRPKKVYYNVEILGPSVLSS